MPAALRQEVQTTSCQAGRGYLGMEGLSAGRIHRDIQTARRQEASDLIPPFKAAEVNA
jgi:hypothetical protein